MKKVILGALVSMILFFGFSTAMWMGGMHNDFTKMTPNSDSLLNSLSSVYSENGVYMLPWHDPNKKMTMAEEEKMMKDMEGKPNAIIQYHTSSKYEMMPMMMKGLLYGLLISLMVAMVLYYGNFQGFAVRFAVSFSFALFGVLTGILTEMNWWDTPMHFAKAGLIDLLGGWALSSVWLAWFIKKPEATA